MAQDLGFPRWPSGKPGVGAGAWEGRRAVLTRAWARDGQVEGASPNVDTEAKAIGGKPAFREAFQRRSSPEAVRDRTCRAPA